MLYLQERRTHGKSQSEHVSTLLFNCCDTRSLSLSLSPSLVSESSISSTESAKLTQMLLDQFWASGVLFILFRLYGGMRPGNPPASQAKLGGLCLRSATSCTEQVSNSQELTMRHNAQVWQGQITSVGRAPCKELAAHLTHSNLSPTRRIQKIYPAMSSESERTPELALCLICRTGLQCELVLHQFLVGRNMPGF